MAETGPWGAWVLVAALAIPGPARADQATDLYDEGLRLLGEGRTAEACTKLEESRAARDGIGVTLYLADCYERLGRTASAWRRYGEAATLADQRDDATRSQVAKKRRAALEPRLRRLEIVPPDDAVGDIWRDGQPVDPAERRVAVPVDPGIHVVEVRARGRKIWETRVEVPNEGTTVRIAVPELAEGAQDPRAGERPATQHPGEAQRWIGIGVAGAGVAGLVVGAVFGALALSRKARSYEAGCGGDNHCPPDAAPIRADAHAAATASTVAFVVGGALVAAGAALFFSAPAAQGAWNGGARSAVLTW